MICVTIPEQKWTDLGHDVHRGIYLLAQLREAGIPVLGSIWPTAVIVGSLTHRLVDGALSWEWTP